MTVDATPALRLDGARIDGPALHLVLAPGELALVRAGSRPAMRALTDLCCGLTPATEGRVEVLGQDWASLREDARRLLRGRIGVVCADGGWAPHLSVAESVLVAALAHRVAPREELRERAATLCRRFGLPGLPLGRPRELREADLARAACARAFLAQPALLILEEPIHGEAMSDLWLPLLNAITAAHGAACLWLTTSQAVLADPAIPAQARLRLTAMGLEQPRRLAA
jgi:phospholipid/cholesterol/gamma-HCH transport system ATP-binding protein